MVCYRKRLLPYLSQNLLWFGQLWKTIFCPQNDFFFSRTFKKTKYFGSQNSSNHLSEVAVEKEALWFSSCFLQIRNFLTRALTLIETHYEITYLSLVDKFVLEVSKWWSMRSTPYVQQLKEKERKEKPLGEKAYIFTIGCSFEDNASH